MPQSVEHVARDLYFEMQKNSKIYLSEFDTIGTVQVTQCKAMYKMFTDRRIIGE